MKDFFVNVFSHKILGIYGINHGNVINNLILKWISHISIFLFDFLQCSNVTARVNHIRKTVWSSGNG